MSVIDTRNGELFAKRNPRMDVVYTTAGLVRANVDVRNTFTTAPNIMTPRTSEGWRYRNTITRGAVSIKDEEISLPTEMRAITTMNASMVGSAEFLVSQNHQTLPVSRRTGYKFNLSGRSVKACGAFGNSTSPASHSGMDPNLPRGQSS
jgi:hypothetical protein